MFPILFCVDPDDQDADPDVLFLAAAHAGSISGMASALEKGASIRSVEPFRKGSALHIAAGCRGAAGEDAVRWLLEKGIPWAVRDGGDCMPETVARRSGNMNAFKILREWAVEKEYEMHYQIPMGEIEDPLMYTWSGMGKDYSKTNEDYCRSAILFTNPDGAPRDEVALVVCPSGEGIMMEWERPIMCETARLLLEGMPTSGLRVLNIGFGIGMIDTYFQDAHPAEHVIIEGHPVCLGWMREKGWYDRPGVKILAGRWQDFLELPQSFPTETDAGLDRDALAGSSKPFDIGKFDIVYFDTYLEGYRGHLSFVKHVPRLLRGPGSRFSFFNGHGAKDEGIFRIYAEVARMHHNDLGLNTQWYEVYTDKNTEWYRLQDRVNRNEVHEESRNLIPICALAPTVPRTLVNWNNFPRP